MLGTKIVIERVLFKLHWSESWASGLPVWEICGKERDPTFIMHQSTLMAMWVLAELQPHTDNSTRLFLWQIGLSSAMAPQQPCKLAEMLVSRSACLPFQKCTQCADIHRLTKGICTQTNMMFSESSVKPC